MVGPTATHVGAMVESVKQTWQCIWSEDPLKDTNV